MPDAGEMTSAIGSTGRHFYLCAAGGPKVVGANTNLSSSAISLPCRARVVGAYVDFCNATIAVKPITKVSGAFDVTLRDITGSADVSALVAIVDGTADTPTRTVFVMSDTSTIFNVGNIFCLHFDADVATSKYEIAVLTLVCEPVDRY